MIVVPEIRSVERTSRAMRLQLAIPDNLSYFEGHFEGCPLLPGVVQLNWAIEFGREHLAIAARFRGLRAVKFMRVIVPSALVTLQLEYARDTHELEFTYGYEDGLYSAGTVLFDAER